VVLGGEYDVLHPGHLGQRGDLVGVEAFGVKSLREFFEEPLAVVVRRADQRVADDHAELTVDRPVDEHTQRQVLEPGDALGLVAGGLLSRLSRRFGGCGARRFRRCAAAREREEHEGDDGTGAIREHEWSLLIP
jgi:hypothetical protein